MNTLAIDIGYRATKARTAKNKIIFSSAVGTSDTARFSLGSNSDTVISHGGNTYLVGDGAVKQSAILSREEGRHWYKSKEYMILFYAAFASLHDVGTKSIEVITGLPVAFLDDSEKLKQIITGEHQFSCNGQKFNVRIDKVTVIPQPFGTLIDLALDDKGNGKDQSILSGTVGIIDCGGKTTNFLEVSSLNEISKSTTSINMGGWDVVRLLREYLLREYPDRDFKDHEISETLESGSITYYGETIDVSSTVTKISETLASAVASTATQRWNSGAHLDKIILTGGGAHLINATLKKLYRHCEVVNDPVFANVNGYLKLASYG